MQTTEKIRRFAVAGMLAGGLILSGCGQKQGGGAPPKGIPEVSVVVAQPQRVALTTELPGRTSAYLVAEVRPQVGGIIQKRLFEEGANVKAGDVLYQIDPAAYQASYDNAKAQLAKAQANLVPLQYKADRYKTLVESKAVSQQEYDDAVAAVGQASAEVAVGAAALENARISLDYTRITAPVSGRIGKSSVTVGALVTASQASALAVIQQMDPLYVDVTQSSAELLRLKRSLESGWLKNDASGKAHCRLLLEDGTPYPLEGTLEFRDVTVSAGTGSVTLRLLFPNPEHALLPGMYVRAVVEQGVAEKAILVPQQGITRDPKGNPLAWVLDNEDVVEQRAVKLDRAIGDQWLVSEGLASGERLVVEGFQKIRPGMTVKALLFSGASGAAAAAVPPAKNK